jgi:hypothetical protein
MEPLSATMIVSLTASQIPFSPAAGTRARVVVDEEQPERRTVKLLDGPAVDFGRYLSGTHLPPAWPTGGGAW